MKPKKWKTAILSAGFAILPNIIAIRATFVFFYGPVSRGQGDDLLELGIISLWTLPLVAFSLIFAGFARGFRIATICFALIAVVLWAAMWVSGIGQM
ncbi:MAG: hypothetical protein ABJC04_04580 [Verrucomicrobiota bacterium]